MLSHVRTAGLPWYSVCCCSFSQWLSSPSVGNWHSFLGRCSLSVTFRCCSVKEKSLRTEALSSCLLSIWSPSRRGWLCFAIPSLPVLSPNGLLSHTLDCSWRYCLRHKFLNCSVMNFMQTFSIETRNVRPWTSTSSFSWRTSPCFCSRCSFSRIIQDCVLSITSLRWSL